MRRKLSHGYSELTFAGWPEQDRRWLQELSGQLGPRKFRLLLSAWSRDLTAACLDTTLQRDKKLCEYVKEVYLAALEVSDRFADTGKSKTALKEARKTTFFRSVTGTGRISAIFDPLLSEDSLVGTLDRCGIAASICQRVPDEKLVPTLRRYLDDLIAPEGDACRLEPTCLDTEMLRLAQTIYEKRQFQQMPELGRALKRRGCQNSRALAHCRTENHAHYRGCLVLDLVLGKE